MCVCMCRYFCVYVSLLRGKHRDHIVPLRVNIPSQVVLISLERKGEKKKEKKDYYKRQEGKKGNCKKKRKERRCQENVSDLRSSGTRAQMQIQEQQMKEIRKGQKEKRDKGGGWGNKYKSPNFKALMVI